MNMSLGTFIIAEQSRKIMNMFVGTFHLGDFKTLINEKQLGHTEHYEDVFMGTLVSNI